MDQGLNLGHGSVLSVSHLKSLKIVFKYNRMRFQHFKL